MEHDLLHPVLRVPRILSGLSGLMDIEDNSTLEGGECNRAQQYRTLVLIGDPL